MKETKGDRAIEMQRIKRGEGGKKETVFFIIIERKRGRKERNREE